LASHFYLASPCFPLYFPSLIFNKLHLYPRVLPHILPGGIQRIWESSDHRMHQCVNILGKASQGVKKVNCYVYWFIFFYLISPWSLALYPFPSVWVFPSASASHPEHAAGRCWVVFY
jgi:hypothetical protein